MVEKPGNFQFVSEKLTFSAENDFFPFKKYLKTFYSKTDKRKRLQKSLRLKEVTKKSYGRKTREFSIFF